MATSIIFLIGPAASGKSSVGKRLSRYYDLTYIDKDVVCNTLTGQLLHENGFNRSDRDGCDYYKDVVMPLEYETILSVAHSNAIIGRSCLIDAPFGAFFSDPHYITNLRKKYEWSDDIHTIVLQVHIDNDELKRRMEARNFDRDQCKFDHWYQYLESIKKASCQWTGIPRIVYDNTELLPPDEELARRVDIEKYLK